MESVAAGISGTVQLDVHYDSGDVGIAVQDCPPNDDASLDLWAALRGEELITAPAIDKPPSPAQTLETNVSYQLPNATGLSPGGPDFDMAPGDKYPIEKGCCAQKVQLTDEREQNDTGPMVIESSLVVQDCTSRAAYGISDNTVPLERSTHDRAHSTYSAGTSNAADPEGSDSDGPPLTSGRRRTLPRTRGSQRPNPPLTPRSSADSTDVESTTACRHRKRLQRRKEMRLASLAPETEDTSASSTTSQSNTEGEWRPVQCLVQRKTNGSQEVMMIQLPAFDLCARSGRVSAISPSHDTSQMTPIWASARGGRRRARFLQAEEDLLVELKERREPRLSWREVQRYFPNRTIGSLQVHYSTHLKGRRTSERRACRRS